MIKINQKSIKHSFEEHLKANEWDNVNEKDLPMYLASPLKLGKGVTFGRIFELIIKHKNLFNVIFYHEMRGFTIDAFINEFRREPQQETEITYLVVSRILDKWHEEYFYNYLDFGGIAENYVDENFSDEPRDTNFGIAFSLLNTLKNLEIRIDDSYTIVDSTKNKMGDTILDEKKPLTLFEFIGAILYEITWHGAPDDRDGVAQSLEETAYKIETGEMKTYSLILENGVTYTINDNGEKVKLFG